MLKSRLLDYIRNFRDDTRGAVSIEFVMMMPLLFWAHMAIFVYFDGYRQSTVNLKAAYTIGDILSRETQEVNDTYIDSLHSMYKELTRAGSQTALRVTIVRFDETDDRYYVDWSANRGFDGAISDANIGSLHTQMPTMPDQERVILVETQNIFVPLFGIGMTNKTLYNKVFTRPRFAPQVVWGA